MDLMENRWVPTRKADDGVGLWKVSWFTRYGWGHDCWTRLWCGETDSFTGKKIEAKVLCFEISRWRKIAERWATITPLCFWSWHFHFFSSFYVLSLRNQTKSMFLTQTKIAEVSKASLNLRLARDASLWETHWWLRLRCSAFVYDRASFLDLASTW